MRIDGKPIYRYVVPLEEIMRIYQILKAGLKLFPRFLKKSLPLFANDIMSFVELLKSRKLLPLGPRHVSNLGGRRYVIYIPQELNYLWKELDESKVKVKVYIEFE